MEFVILFINLWTYNEAASLSVRKRKGEGRIVIKLGFENKVRV